MSGRDVLAIPFLRPFKSRQSLPVPLGGPPDRGWQDRGYGNRLHLDFTLYLFLLFSNETLVDVPNLHLDSDNLDLTVFRPVYKMETDIRVPLPTL